MVNTQSAAPVGVPAATPKPAAAKPKPATTKPTGNAFVNALGSWFSSFTPQ
jgi:hypothetical protein